MGSYVCCVCVYNDMMSKRQKTQQRLKYRVCVCVLSFFLCILTELSPRLVGAKVTKLAVLRLTEGQRIQCTKLTDKDETTE